MLALREQVDDADCDDPHLAYKVEHMQAQKAPALSHWT